jgi:FKBP-type peptidyl-prolyl cis-trans isomerase
VKAGEECEILFCGKYGFGNSTFGIIPANSALAFKIWVVSVSNE